MIFYSDIHGETCTNIDLHTTRDSYKWQLGPCISSLKFSRIGTYTEKCCVPNDDQILSCRSDQPDGWGNSVVAIGNHQFCDDSVGYNQLIKLNIPGEHANQ